ncbi:MAG: hypothetical protein HY721_25965, partial [Planctomycetes bacterium]|nr:hypothetical protein [Planctomycetota bacterium]
MAPSEPHEPGEARELHELHELQELHEPNELVEPREPVGPLEGVRELLPLAVRGDREAVTRVVAAFLPRVYGLCLRIVRNRDLALEGTLSTWEMKRRGRR